LNILNKRAFIDELFLQADFSTCSVIVSRKKNEPDVKNDKEGCLARSPVHFLKKILKRALMAHKLQVRHQNI
jgi:hypothetical protein